MRRFQFYNLATPEDLFRKLEYDYQQLQVADRDTFEYFAFNFFITAYHMLDWIFPGNKNKDKRKSEENCHVILQICSHIANGVKHFILDNLNLHSVTYTDYVDVPPQMEANEPNDFYIKLDGEAARLFGNRVKCIDIARKVIEFWSNHEGYEISIPLD